MKKNVVIAISSDKGLCGGINTTSVKVSRGVKKLNDGNYCCPGYTYNIYFFFPLPF